MTELIWEGKYDAEGRKVAPPRIALLEWLNRGIDERDAYFPENFFDPLLDHLRHDSRYPAVLARLGQPTPAQ